MMVVSVGARTALGMFVLVLAGNGSLAQESKDNSGTNPAVLNRSVSVSNEYRFLEGDSYYDVFSMKYSEPFADGRAAVRLNVPFAATDIPGNDKFGLSDASAKLTWVAYLDRRMGLITSGELGAPTASEDVLGSGKWTIAPGITWANFLSPEIIVAPAYVHTFSFAGDNDRNDINRGDFDLYFVYKPQGERWWITTDFTAGYDFENDKVPMSFEVSFGRNLAVLENGAAVNGYVRPGVGIGDDRPYDFNIEAGISVVGF
jgi:hypothetical protein